MHVILKQSINKHEPHSLLRSNLGLKKFEQKLAFSYYNIFKKSPVNQQYNRKQLNIQNNKCHLTKISSGYI
eukprot:403363482